jgi:hypothetical protein
VVRRDPLAVRLVRSVTGVRVVRVALVIVVTGVRPETVDRVLPVEIVTIEIGRREHR